MMANDNPDAGRASRRAQSAMEYLMTYGWAILIIGVVLAALYSIGLFSGNNVSNNCLAAPGYLCNAMTFSTNPLVPCGYNNMFNNGNGKFPSMNATIGASSGVISGQWTNIYFVVVPANQSITDTSLAGQGNKNNILYWGWITGHYGYASTLVPNQQVPISMCISPIAVSSSNTIGYRLRGSVWVMYSNQYVTNALVQIAKFNAVSSG